MIEEQEKLEGQEELLQSLDTKDRVRYAAFAATQVIGIYEKAYPHDDRPRKAIEAAEKCIAHNSPENRDYAASAATDADYASHTADTAAPARAPRRHQTRGRRLRRAPPPR